MHLRLCPKVSTMERDLLLSRLALCSESHLPGAKLPGGGPYMATASEAHPTDRALSDREFEELLQKTWEFVQSQKGVTAVKVVHPFEPSSESPSWT